MNILEIYQKPSIMSRVGNWMNNMGNRNGYGTRSSTGIKDEANKMFSHNAQEFKKLLLSNLKAMQKAFSAILPPKPVWGQTSNTLDQSNAALGQPIDQQNINQYPNTYTFTPSKSITQEQKEAFKNGLKVLVEFNMLEKRILLELSKNLTSYQRRTLLEAWDDQFQIGERQPQLGGTLPTLNKWAITNDLINGKTSDGTQISGKVTAFSGPKRTVTIDKHGKFHIGQPLDSGSYNNLNNLVKKTITARQEQKKLQSQPGLQQAQQALQQQTPVFNKANVQKLKGVLQKTASDITQFLQTIDSIMNF